MMKANRVLISCHTEESGEIIGIKMFRSIDPDGIEPTLYLGHEPLHFNDQLEFELECGESMVENGVVFKVVLDFKV